LKLKNTHSVQQQEYIEYAWQISQDPTFLYLLKAENGTLDPTRKSDIIGANGYRDIGICQINIGYHPHIVHDTRFTDWKWQIQKCYELYKGGTRFYGLSNINKVKHHFEWTT
jgi:hypothetical protein